MRKPWALVVMVIAAIVVSFAADAMRMNLREQASSLSFDFSSGIALVSVATFVLLALLFLISYVVLRFAPPLAGGVTLLVVGLLLVALPFLQIRELPMVWPPRAMQITYISLSGQWFFISGIAALVGRFAHKR